ncbi:MAG: hypothetical protein SH850_02785 [Planctomycetaceae bacterium]|nr:hypothetical protein [Planctomycetaceae bacterium]MDZ4779904.1 hypothetical protein [Planctomycetia bacterium]MDZ4856162.1 hypothetical protein [Nitrospirota bacterium]
MTPVNQTSEQSCCIACLESVFADAWPSERLDEAEIIRRGVATIESNGTIWVPDHLELLLEKVVGKPVKVTSQVGTAKLQAEVDAGKFVLLFTREASGGLHVVRYGGDDGTGIRVMEPASGAIEIRDAAWLSSHTLDARIFDLPAPPTPPGEPGTRPLIRENRSP